MNSKDKKERKYKKPISDRLRFVLIIVLGLFSLLVANSIYLLVIRSASELTKETYENWFFLIMFLLHLALGFALLIPFILFLIFHIKAVWNHRNRRAVAAGWGLLAIAITLLVTGVLLTRVEGVVEINNPAARSVIWWIHVITPLGVVWLFILHRLAGVPIKWKVGAGWAAAAFGFAMVMVLLQAQDPRQWNIAGNPSGEEYFEPSLARTVSGDFIASNVLDNDQYCLECHADIHSRWHDSVHHFASFNNPVYAASVEETRNKSLERDGDVRASRFCAGCHDPVVFFSGRFDDPLFDPNTDPTGHAGITCTVCHAISNVNSPRGNADYTIDEPIHYPFAFSEKPFFKWVNHQLVKAKPAFHKKTFLKPLHKTAEFCGTCHKVHLPEVLNDYKWLRGQNHYDSWRLSGVSGHNVASFYYPAKAQTNCNGCHMPEKKSDDFGSFFSKDGQRVVHDHLFPGANTAIPTMVDVHDSEAAIQAHKDLLENSLRVDIFGIRRGGRLDGELLAPLDQSSVVLRPGEEILLEVVLRTLTLGHHFTQGTADSNQVWLELVAYYGDEEIGSSGLIDASSGEVDPWSHFVNSFVIDKNGDRISRRNAQDIFTAVYNHQIPPGAADVIHYRIKLPKEKKSDFIKFKARLRYRKFDTELVRFTYKDDSLTNKLPIVTIASDEVVLPIESPFDFAEPLKSNGNSNQEAVSSIVPTWERFNDYGIGLLRQGALAQAEDAFLEVEKRGRPEGPINLARVYIEEGRVTYEAPSALERAALMESIKPLEWHLLWFNGLVNQQNGRFEKAIRNFEQILVGGFAQSAGKSFSFNGDDKVHMALGNALWDRAKQERGDSRKDSRKELLDRAIKSFQQVLKKDPEHVGAHWSLSRIWKVLGNDEKSDHHSALHATYKSDDNARDAAVSIARKKYPWANKAAEVLKIYSLDN